MMWRLGSLRYRPLLSDSSSILWFASKSAHFSGFLQFARKPVAYCTTTPWLTRTIDKLRLAQVPAIELLASEQNQGHRDCLLDQE